MVASPFSIIYFCCLFNLTCGGFLVVGFVVWIFLQVFVPSLSSLKPSVEWVSYPDAVGASNVDVQGIHGDVGFHADDA